MAFTGSFLTNLAKQNYLRGIYRAADTYKMAFYSNSATLDATTTTYSSTNEVTNGAVIPAGGVTLSGFSYGNSGGVGYVDFADVSVTVTGTFTARGAVIYDATSGTNGGTANEVIAVIDFGSDKTATDGAFTVQIPSSGNGIIRFGP